MVKVGIIYGGKSSEHEVSLRSAASVYRFIDRTRFDPYLIYIDELGQWHGVGQLDLETLGSALPKMETAPRGMLVGRSFEFTKSEAEAIALDVVMPMVHGKNCEDGTLQGLFEISGLPYTGSGVLGSSIGMDKEVSKRLASLDGIPVVPYLLARASDSLDKIQSLKKQAAQNLGYPLFMKAAREGSSVGVFKVKSEADFDSTLQKTFEYDTKVLIERGIEAREIEFSVIENETGGEPWVSRPAEIIPTHEFYTYEAKYLDENGAIFKIPAELDEVTTQKLTQLVKKIFVSLELEGYARIDLFLDRKNGAFYLNEANTLPGFTSISMFPKLCEITGLPYKELLTKLLDLALLRYKRKSSGQKNS